MSSSLGEVIARRGHTVKLRTGQVLFREGDDSQSVYACTAGRINLFITTPAGREVMLGSKGPVQAFGELSALDGEPRSATAVAMEPSTIAVLNADQFLDELQNAPLLALQVLRELSAHIRVSNARTSGRTSDSVTVRVAYLLLELGEKFGRHASPSTAVSNAASNAASAATVAAASATVSIPVTQDELAAWVGSTREAVARSLATLRREMVVETGRNSITIADPIRLLQLATNPRP